MTVSLNKKEDLLLIYIKLSLSIFKLYKLVGTFRGKPLKRQQLKL